MDDLSSLDNALEKIPAREFLLGPQSNFSAAVNQWFSLLGPSRVEVDPSAIEHHGRNAIGSKKRGSAVLRPETEKQVQEIVRIAASLRIPLYPISTGRNWGYGAASPVVDGSVIVELADLKNIRIVDEELGIVSLQPGVTQGMLYQFLKEHQSNLMVPVHGGGPSCSIVGNALERGYGLTPATDHFSALTSLRAVLSNGSMYVSPFHAMGAELIGSCHRWGIGSYVEGLFSQGNFGIVTEATFTLVRRPEHTEAFFLRITDDQQLGEVVDHLRTVLTSLGGNVVGVNLMNDRRVLSMSRPYPNELVGTNEIISSKKCNEMAKGAGISAWTAAGIIHCPSLMKRVVRRTLKSLLPASVSRPIHLDRRRLSKAKAIAAWTPFGRDSILQQISSIDALLDVAEGIPRRVALPLAYWLRGELPSTETDLNPAQDGCGLIWYSPLVPMKSVDAQRFSKMVKRICTAHSVEPLITLTSLSAQLFDATVPLLFQPEKPGAEQRATDCYKALLDAGGKAGFLPYRLGTTSVDFLEDKTENSHFSFVANLKTATDPEGIISPGRYSPNQASR